MDYSLLRLLHYGLFVSSQLETLFRFNAFEIQWKIFAMRIDFFDAAPGQTVFPLNPPRQAPGLPDALFGGKWWIGDSFGFSQITQFDGTMIAGVDDGFEEDEQFRTVISGEDLEVNNEGLLVGGTVTGISFYIGSRLVAEFSDMPWSAAALGTAADDRFWLNSGSGLNALLQITPLEFDASRSSAPIGLNFYGFEQNITVFGSLGSDEIVGSEGADTIVGDAGNDTIRSHGSGNHLFGGGGNDHFFMSTSFGADTVEGGAGASDYVWYLANGSVTVDLRDSSKNAGLAVGDVLLGIENVVGALQDDWISGDRAANFLNGVSGLDEIYGRGGNDIIGMDSAWEGTKLFGGAGRDTFFCSSATGILFHGGNGVDTVDFDFNYYGVSGVEVDMRTPLSGSEVSNARFVSIENIKGSIYGDKILGDKGSNLFSGNSGDDTLDGRSGSDTLRGGTGQDLLNGGKGADTLFGNRGDDTLRGGVGNDQLTGGQGADFFEFNGRRIGQNLVTDFTTREDVLRLDASLWNAELTAEDVVAIYCREVDGNAVFDFGNGNNIILLGVSNPVDIISDIAIF